MVIIKELKNIRDILYNHQDGVREYHLESDNEFAENYHKDMGNIIKKLNKVIEKVAK